MVRRVDLKRLAEISDGLLFVALFVVGDATVVVGDGIIRGERNGLVVVLDGVIMPSGPRSMCCQPLFGVRDSTRYQYAYSASM